MSPDQAAYYCLGLAGLVFLYVAEQLVSGAWRRRRFERARYVMVMCRHADGWVLILKQRPAHLAGYLLGPGGKVEPGEDVVVAAVRELHEETGVLGIGWWRIGVKRSDIGGDIAIFAAAAMEGEVPRSLTSEEVVVLDFDHTSESVTYFRDDGAPGQPCVVAIPVWHDVSKWAGLAEQALACRKDLI